MDGLGWALTGYAVLMASLMAVYVYLAVRNTIADARLDEEHRLARVAEEFGLPWPGMEEQ